MEQPPDNGQEEEFPHLSSMGGQNDDDGGPHRGVDDDDGPNGDPLQGGGSKQSTKTFYRLQPVVLDARRTSMVGG